MSGGGTWAGARRRRARGVCGATSRWAGTRAAQTPSPSSGAGSAGRASRGPGVCLWRARLLYRRWDGRGGGSETGAGDGDGGESQAGRRGLIMAGRDRARD